MDQPPNQQWPRTLDGLDHWESNLIQRLVGDFTASHKLPGWLEKTDLIQQCEMHWWMHRRRWSPSGGASPSTYLRRVVRAKLQDIADGFRASKRGGGRSELRLNDPTAAYDDLTLGELIPDSANTAAQVEWQIAKQNAFRRLTERQRHVMQGLDEGESIAEISRRLHVSRDTLYEERRRIRKVFRDEGLADFSMNYVRQIAHAFRIGTKEA